MAIFGEFIEPRITVPLKSLLAASKSNYSSCSELKKMEPERHPSMLGDILGSFMCCH